MSHFFSYYIQDFLCDFYHFFDFQNFYYDASVCESHYLYPASSLSFLGCVGYCFSINLGSFLIFFWTFFLLSSLFWYSHYTCVGALDGVPHFSEALFIFFFLFSHLSDCIILIDLSSCLLFLYSASLHLLLSSIVNSSFQLYFFNSRIAIWLFFFYHFSLLIFPT